jgi:hypothetical protein
MPGPLVQQLGFLYCTQTDIETQMSIKGVRLRIHDPASPAVPTSNVPGKSVSEQPSQVLQDAIVEATETCNFYLWSKYDPMFLAQSNWVNRKATFLACYRIGSSRSNPPPDTWVEDALKAEEDLKAVADGPRIIPGLPLRRTLAPVMSNVRFVPWPYQFRCLRVERQNSSAHNRSQLPQNIDYQEAYTTWDFR